MQIIQQTHKGLSDDNIEQRICKLEVAVRKSLRPELSDIQGEDGK